MPSDAAADDRSPAHEAALAERDGVAGVWDHGRRALTAGLVLIISLVASEALAIGTVLPLVERDLGQLALYGWVFSAFFLGNLAGIAVAGRAADRLPLTVPFGVGVALFAVGLAIGGAAPSMPVLVAARAVQGLGAGALPATAYVAIGRGYPDRLRPRMFALLSTAWVVPSLFGPGLAGVVGEQVGWRWVFLGLLPLIAVGAVVALAAVRRLARPVHEDPDAHPIGTSLVLALGAGALLAGLGAHNLAVAGALVVAGLVIGVPAFRRLTPEGTLRARPGLPATVLARGVLTFAFFCADSYVPLALTGVRGTSTSIAGGALTAATLTWTSSAWVQERYVHRVGPRRLARIGFAILAVGVALLVPALDDEVPVVFAIAAFALAGSGIGLVYAPLSVTVLGVAEPGREGRAAAALQLSDVLGIALGAGVGGAIVAGADAARWAPRAGLTAVFAVSAAVAVCGLVLCRRIPARLTEA